MTSKFEALKYYNAIWKAIDNGEATVADVVEAHRWLSEGYADLAADVKKEYTVKELRAMLPHSWSTDKKAELVKKYTNNLLNRFAFLVVLSFNTGTGTMNELRSGTKEEREALHRLRAFEARSKILEGLTPELLESHADVVRTREAIERDEAERKAQALEAPKTYYEWISLYQHRMNEAGGASAADVFDDDELASFDAAVYAENERRHRAQVAVDTMASTEVSISVFEEHHTKTGDRIWVARLDQKVPRSTYIKLREIARRHGGKWSKFSKGFLFYDEEKAFAFSKVGGDEEIDDDGEFDLAQRRERERRMADRLEQYAIRNAEKGDESLQQERLQNTARRAAMAAHAESEARWQKAFAATVQSVATAMKNGKLKALAGVRYATDIEALLSVLNRATRDGQPGVPAAEQNGPAPEYIRFVRVPYPHLTEGQLVRLHNDTHRKRGLGQSRTVVAEMLKGADGGMVTTMSSTEADAIVALVDALNLENDFEFEWRIKAYKRLKRMGINTLPMLRHALREFLPHVVEPEQGDPLAEALRDLVGRRIPGYYPTPVEVADYMVGLADPQPNEIGLESSAGSGNLIDAVLRYCPKAQMVYYEPNYDLGNILGMKYGDNDRLFYAGPDGTACLHDAPRHTENGGYDYAVINPPFEAEQDMRHVRTTYQALRPGGRMVAIISASRQRNATFMGWLERVGGWIDTELPSGTFHESGADVASLLIVIEKAGKHAA